MSDDRVCLQVLLLYAKNINAALNRSRLQAVDNGFRELVTL